MFSTMNTSCEMYPTSQQPPQFQYEQQMPSTSYGDTYNAPCASPFTYGNQQSGYFPSDYGMRISYPQGQPVQNSSLMRSDTSLTYSGRPNLECRKMLNTHAWVKDHRFMNIAHEHRRPGSVASSRMTRMSAATDMSMSSVHSLLSDVQRLAKLRISHSAVPSSSSSCVENIDPNRNIEYEQTVSACLDNISNIIQESISMQDKSLLRNAVDSFFEITKHNDFNVASSRSLETLMQKLVDLISRLDPENLEPELASVMEKNMSAISRMLAFEKIKLLMSKFDVKGILRIFIKWLIPTQKFCLFTLTSVHSLVEMVLPHELGTEVKELILLRTVSIMALMEQRNSQYFINSPKRKQYVFVLIRYVLRNDEGAKLFFLSKGGTGLLLRLLDRERDESTAFRIIHVLYALVSTPNKIFSLQFNSLGGIKTLMHVLEQASSYCVIQYILLCLRAISDITEVRTADNREAINYVMSIVDRYKRAAVDNFSNCVNGRDELEKFKNLAYILNIAVEFLGNIAVSNCAIKNLNKDYIVGCGAVIPYVVEMLALFMCARNKFRNVKEIDNLIAEIIWSLKIFTGECSNEELTRKARIDLMRCPKSAELLLQELAGAANISPNLQCRSDILNILIRVVQTDPLNHPQLLRNVPLPNESSIASILFDIICTTSLREVNSKALGKQITIKTYELLLLLAKSSFNFGNEIRCICNINQVAYWLLSAAEDPDLVRCTLEFITFVAADDTFRDHLSKEMTLVSLVRQLAEQVNENSAAAQSLLFSLTCETMVPFGTISML